MRTLIATAMVFLLAGSGSAETVIETRVDEDTREWNFTVYLDDKEIGYHTFRVDEMPGGQQLLSEADFEVRFLFFTAYEYEHWNRETWRDECLYEIRSETDANGQRFRVRGEKTGDGFEVEATNVSKEVDGCIKTFAYWDPRFLEEDQLLNAQTGELLDVDVQRVARETLTLRGQQIDAQRYRLQAKNVEVDVWYSDDECWVALESTVKGGRKLRYVLS